MYWLSSTTSTQSDWTMDSICFFERLDDMVMQDQLIRTMLLKPESASGLWLVGLRGSGP
jgi:hypothetical protein